MNQMIAFGIGNYYKQNEEWLNKKYNIVAFCDNASGSVFGNDDLFSRKPIINVEEIKEYVTSDIIITTPLYKYEIISQLVEMGIEVNRIHVITPEWMERCCSSVAVVVGGVKICIDGIEMIISNNMEEMICREIWENEDYNINVSSDSIVIDIGMNVGYATLFFANKKFVKRVYSFEPESDVYNKAIVAIAMNKAVNKKIQTYQVACSNCNKEEVYIVHNTKSAGMHKERIGEVIDESQKRNIKCIDSAEVLGEIIDTHWLHERIVVKCDCEGAEYEILYRLEETGYLEKIDVFVMEWHLNRRDEIEKIFSRNNFTYMVTTAPGRCFGKCYAVRNGK